MDKSAGWLGVGVGRGEGRRGGTGGGHEEMKYGMQYLKLNTNCCG